MSFSDTIKQTWQIIKNVCVIISAISAYIVLLHAYDKPKVYSSPDRYWNPGLIYDYNPQKKTINRERIGKATKNDHVIALEDIAITVEPIRNLVFQKKVSVSISYRKTRRKKIEVSGHQAGPWVGIEFLDSNEQVINVKKADQLFVLESKCNDSQSEEETIGPVVLFTDRFSDIEGVNLILSGGRGVPCDSPLSFESLSQYEK